MGESLSESDPNSFSNPEQCIVTEIDLHIEVDFEKHILKGFVDLSVERKNLKADLILDTRDLTIENVRNKNSLAKMTYTLSDPIEPFGSKLEIKLPKRITKKYCIRIDYETSSHSTALQWLEPLQTAGKKHPYVYSHCEAIHARSMFPCQDTPGVKAPYSATVTVPYELTALMSAIRDGEEMDEDPLMKNYKFVQRVPIPSYLVAIAVGALESREIGPRSHVWSEKEFVDKAAEEFSEVEKMLSVAENLLGEYVWEIYDLLILPPSFPMGGMENPCLTFLTPTLLAGDKSLVNIVAHEIAHSWTGNLVTNRNFEHFWLNEGFTSFLESKLIGRLCGEPAGHFLASQGWIDLKYAVEVLGEKNPLTKLVPDLKGVDPDDSFSSVPYEKGQSFLRYLEIQLGGADVFEEFLRAYIDEYKYQSIDTDTWKNFLFKYFSGKEDILRKVDWNAWLYSPGMPPVKPDYDISLGKKCFELCDAWIKADDNDLGQFTIKDIAELSAFQVQETLSLLLQEEPLSVKKIEHLTDVYKLKEKMNAEIRFRWIRLGLKSHWKDIIDHAIQFITEVGRLKFVSPIYRDMYEWDETQDKAIATFQKNRKEMMSITVSAVSKDLRLAED